MLRPEQLQITQVAPEAAANATGLAACYGAVVDADFGGPVSVLSVRLVRASSAILPPDDEVAWNIPLQVRSQGIHAPPVGAMVRITVAGQAHVFDAA